jgi:hypothetical protein
MSKLVAYSQSFSARVPMKAAVMLQIDCKDELHKQQIINETKTNDFSIFSFVLYYRLKNDNTDFIDYLPDRTEDELINPITWKCLYVGNCKDKCEIFGKFALKWYLFMKPNNFTNKNLYEIAKRCSRALKKIQSLMFPVYSSVEFMEPCIFSLCCNIDPEIQSNALEIFKSYMNAVGIEFYERNSTTIDEILKNNHFDSFRELYRLAKTIYNIPFEIWLKIIVYYLR